MGHDPSSDPRLTDIDPVTDEAVDWFIRLQDRPQDEALIAAFERWRSVDPRRAEAVSRLDKMMTMPELRLASRRDAARLNATARPGPSRWRRYAALAAVLLLVVIAAWHYPTLMLRWQADYLTMAGEQQKIRLPDGSTMTLNTASAVALEFSDGRREVKLLAGEAFFDVRPDPAHPFAVEGQFSDVTVIGTAFSVRTHDDADTVLLARGRVEVSRLADRSDHVELAPGQRVTAVAAALSPVEGVLTEENLAWLDGRVIFHDAPLAEALADLGRYYGASVLIAGVGVSGRKVSGSYRVDDAEAAIRTLAAAAGATATRLPGGFIIVH